MAYKHEKKTGYMSINQALDTQSTYHEDILEPHFQSSHKAPNQQTWPPCWHQLTWKSMSHNLAKHAIFKRLRTNSLLSNHSKFHHMTHWANLDPHYLHIFGSRYVEVILIICPSGYLNLTKIKVEFWCDVGKPIFTMLFCFKPLLTGIKWLQLK